MFRDAPIDEVAATAAALRLDVVQLHGSEDPDEVRKGLGKDVEVWGVCSDGAASRPGADRSLFDTGSGGTGRTFDWSLLAGREDVASGLLAGGIGQHNARAAARVGAYGLDVGSGVEARPGEKDQLKVTALFDTLRPACRGESA